MNILKRAYLSISRRKGKSLILILVIFLIGNIIAGATSIYQATNNLETSMKTQLGAKAKIELDFSKLGQGSNSKPLTPELIDKISNFPQVKTVSYSLQSMVGSDNLNKVESKKEESESGFESSVFVGGAATIADFHLIGAKGEVPSEISSGEIKITEGRYPSNDANLKEVLISEELARSNKVKLNDTIKMHHSIIDYEDTSNDVNVLSKTEIDFKVVGMFKLSEKINNNRDSFQDIMNDMKLNTMYTAYQIVDDFDFKSAEAFYEFSGSNCSSVDACRSIITPFFELNTPDDIDSFVEQVNQFLENDLYKVTTSKDSFDNIAGSILNMKDMSKTVLIFGIILSILILFFVLILFLRDRKHEFGIYQALGESPFKSMSQLIIEVIVIAMVSITLSLFTGSKLAASVSNNMIENHLKEVEKTNEQTMIIIGSSQENSFSDLTEKDIIDSYEITFSREYIVSFYTVMLGSSLIATLASSVYIFKLKPREILL